MRFQADLFSSTAILPGASSSYHGAIGQGSGPSLAFCSASPRPAGAKTPGSLPSFPCQMPSRISLPPCVFLRPFRAAPRAGSLVPVPEGTARRRAASGATGGLGGLLGALRVSISAPRSLLALSPAPQAHFSIPSPFRKRVFQATPIIPPTIYFSCPPFAPLEASGVRGAGQPGAVPLPGGGCRRGVPGGRRRRRSPGRSRPSPSGAGRC